MNAELIMQNLRIVSMVSEQDKLVTNPRFGLRPATTWRAMVRRWMGENRDTDLQNLRNLFGSAICLAQLNEATVHHPAHHRHCGSNARHAVSIVSTDRLVESIHRALGGLHILQRTYHDDHEMCAKLDLLVQEVEDHVSAIRSEPAAAAVPPLHPTPYTSPRGSASPAGCRSPFDSFGTDTAPPAAPPPPSPLGGP